VLFRHKNGLVTGGEGVMTSVEAKGG
jgi:hypothetical protein